MLLIKFNFNNHSYNKDASAKSKEYPYFVLKLYEKLICSYTEIYKDSK
jgi:hypothetical protein